MISILKNIALQEKIGEAIAQVSRQLLSRVATISNEPVVVTYSPEVATAVCDWATANELNVTAADEVTAYSQVQSVVVTIGFPVFSVN